MPDTWVATSFGALDVRNSPIADCGAEILLLPTDPSEPIGLQGDVAAMWRRLTEGSVRDGALSATQQKLVREFEAFGCASRDSHHPARTTSVPRPWLRSPFHELIYSLVAHLARKADVGVVFIKGPALHVQGLRRREHSGDVDAWVDPDGIGLLCESLRRWGWSPMPTIMAGLAPSHSIALRPASWGCEIDLHYDFPGVAGPRKQSFAALCELRQSLTFAGTSVSVPAPAAHAVISALHTTRPQVGHRLHPALESRAAEAIRVAGPRTIAAARRLRADAALSPVLAAEFPEQFTAPEYEVPLNWRWRTQPTRFRSYFMMLRLVPASKRASWLFRAVWPMREYALTWAQTVDGRSRSAFDARCRRLLRGIRRSSP